MLAFLTPAILAARISELHPAAASALDQLILAEPLAKILLLAGMLATNVPMLARSLPASARQRRSDSTVQQHRRRALLLLDEAMFAVSILNGSLIVACASSRHF